MSRRIVGEGKPWFRPEPSCTAMKPRADASQAPDVVQEVDMAAKAPFWTAVCVVAILVLAPGTRAALVDQYQSVVDSSTGGFRIGGPTRQELAQIVTAGISGDLVEVRLPVSCTSGELTLEVQRVAGNAPDGEVLASHSLPATDLAPPATSHTLVLLDGLPVQAGDRFALVLSATDSCEILAGPPGNSYARGQGLFRDRDSRQGAWLPLGVRADLPFETVVSSTAERVLVGFQSDSKQDDPADEDRRDDSVGGFVFVSCFLKAVFR